MVTALLLISFLLLLAALASYTFQRRSLKTPDAIHWFPAHESAGLFNDAATLRALALEEAHRAADARRQTILEQAFAGAHAALLEAYAEGDAAFYDAALNRFLDGCHNPVTLAQFLEQHPPLPANERLTEALSDACSATLSPHNIVQLLHLAARTGDAAVFLKVLEIVRRADVPAQELARLAESAYWLLPQPARSSGAGFMLKHELSAAKNNPRNHTKIH